MTSNVSTYGSVWIEPRYSQIRSRTHVDLGTFVGLLGLKLPVISANMKNITGSKMAGVMAYNGACGFLHRFCSVEENVEMYKEAISLGGNSNVGVSIGVNEIDTRRFLSLYKEGARVFCIDVAHGHHVLVKEMIEWIHNVLGDNRKEVTIIAGNIATAGALRDMVEWGVDAVKVGIGPSPVCRTRNNTGVGVPQLYALEEVHAEKIMCSSDVSIIADGGISCVGDIAKALRYADAVMIGSMLAGCAETPGSVYRNEEGDYYKTYGGSASGENKGNNRFIEGIVKPVKFKGKTKYVLNEIKQGLQSAFSYTGSSNHTEFQCNCRFVHNASTCVI